MGRINLSIIICFFASVLVILTFFSENLFSAKSLRFNQEFEFSDFDYQTELDNQINKKRDTLKTDTILAERRMSNEIKFLLDKSGDFSILLNEKSNFVIKSDGNIGVGNKNPQYRIDVCGSIRASEELIVETNTWCDFVFDENYKLETFNKRMESIRQNKHLPYVLPQEKITDEGIPMSETLTGILQNVEELYLYIEQLENRIKVLEDENKKLESNQPKN